MTDANFPDTHYEVSPESHGSMGCFIVPGVNSLLALLMVDHRHAWEL